MQKAFKSKCGKIKDLYIFSSNFLQRQYLYERKQATKLQPLTIMDFIGSSHLQFCWRVTPRCLRCFKSVSSVFSNFRIGAEDLFFCDTFISSVLVLLKVTFHLVAQVLIFSKSEFSISALTLWLSRHKYILVSFANNSMTDSMSFTISFI